MNATIFDLHLLAFTIVVSRAGATFYAFGQDILRKIAVSPTVRLQGASHHTSTAVTGGASLGYGYVRPASLLDGNCTPTQPSNSMPSLVACP